jgi:hypothetical protein
VLSVVRFQPNIEPHLAGMAEDHIALRVLTVLVQPDARAALAQDACQRRLAYLDRLAARNRAFNSSRSKVVGWFNVGEASKAFGLHKD